MSLFVRVFHNGDHACIVWGPDSSPRQSLAGCLGFALYRKQQGQSDADAIVLHNFTSFDLANQQPGVSKESTAWPIQKFTWWDYAPTTGGNGPFQYKVVPLCKDPQGQGDPIALKPMPAPAAGDPWPDWSDPALEVSGNCGDGISCFFNRGIVAAEWVSRALRQRVAQDNNPQEALGVALNESIAMPGNVLRDELGGVLKAKLIDLLKESQKNGETIFAALYELNDPELLNLLEAFGPKANVILANGAFSKEKPDENKEARDKLRGQETAANKVNLFDRMVSQGHFAHNKFVVFCDAQGKPQKAWTGSTNWSMTGLCTQANNGLLLEDPAVADAFMEQWERLHEAGNDFPDSLKSSNSQKKQFTMGQSTVTTWFVPTLHQEDLQHARRLINGAQNGILFLMFEPGAFEAEPAKWTLLQSILNRHQPPPNPYNNADLYIRGVVNQEIPSLTEDPKTIGHELDPSAATHNTTLFSSGNASPFRTTDDVLAPAAIKAGFGPWVPTLLNQGVKIHSKMIVIDPFGTHPVVMTGSHNMGYKASSMNDDNLIIIENNPLLAQAYAANAIAIYNQYRTNAFAAKPGAIQMFQLKQDDTWQKNYFIRPDADDLNFWLK